MKDELLDEIEIRNNEKIFSRLSFFTSIITIILVGYLLSSIPRTIKASDVIQEPSRVIILTTQIACVTGLIMMILSIVRKEPRSWMKLVGGIMNVIIFLLLIGSAIFARIV